MTDKVWFKLRHTHNTAPDVTTLGTAQETGPVLLGHFIPDLNHLDQVINRGGIKPFPEEMRIWPSKTVEFKWGGSQSAQAAVSTSARAPVDGANVVTLEASASVAFKESVENFAEFESMDCYIVNPIKSYIEKLLAADPVADHISSIKTLGTWKLFIITGIMIARGAKTRSEEHSNKDGGFKAGLSVPGFAGASSDASAARNSSQSLSGTSTTDFVWAVRLARISKTLSQVLLAKDWSIDTESGGATFAPGQDDEINVSEVVKREGMTEVSRIIEDEQLGLAFVLD